MTTDVYIPDNMKTSYDKMTIDDIDPIKMEKLNKFINDNKNNV